MSKLMLSCREATQMVSESMDRKLPFQDRVLIRMHLLMCRYCSRFSKQMKILRNVSRAHAEHSEEFEPYDVLRDEVRTRIVDLMKQYPEKSG